MQQKKLVVNLRRCLPYLAAPLLLSSVAAQAQQATAPIQRVEITGSHIRRAEAESSNPIQVLSRADIEKSGKTTVAELLQTLAVDNQGSVPTSFGNGFASGASGISLRGLGAASTLVLLNGRRMAPYGLADDGQKVFSDLNVIPAEAVERVEVLKGGASALYGSDAIAGVVNIILRKEIKGTTVRASQGLSQERDGGDTRLALTTGFGDLDSDRYNVLFNAEFGLKREVWNRDRSDRGAIGKSDLRDFGFSAQESLGGTGAIVDNNLAGSSIVGNVRNPTTLDYYSRSNLAGVGFTRTFPGADCSKLTSHPQGDPLGGCLTDAAQEYGQIQPRQKTANLFTRATVNLSQDWQAYFEGNAYRSESIASGTPSGISGSVGYPGGPVSNAAVALGAAHPDNPYFGTAARLRYLAADVGPRVSNVDSNFYRALIGVKGTAAGWDIDTAYLYSATKVSNERSGYLQRDVTFALLNPTAANVAAAMGNARYAALPAGSFWRIGENAGLNSRELYAALSPNISNDAATSISQIDFKASREIAKWEAGSVGLAFGAEYRRAETRLAPTEGTDKGNIIGLGYSAYDGKRNESAVYAEMAIPLHKTLEAQTAIRWDHFSDVGNSYTPKLGLKWNPTGNFALRANAERGFRAPSAAENGKGGLAAFSTATDPVRCALGVASACNPASVAIITSPNPALSPERSKSYSVGILWDPMPRTSFALDLWQIKRTNEINQEQTDAAIAAGHVARDPSTATNIPGDPGAITAVLANYVNSASTIVRGVDLDARKSFALGDGNGTLTIDAKWTHLIKMEREEKDGSKRDFAGTHGNCDATNCMGTPDNRVNLGVTWERDALRMSLNMTYRDKLDNINFKDDPDGCASHFAEGFGGGPAPAGCKISSFTTFDLVGRYRLSDKAELFGSINNLFDKKAPLDPLTYGAQSYNPLDYSGALGRYFNIGMRYKF